jgi:phage-related protein
MRNYFTFAGIPSTDFGLYINGQGVFGSPAYSYDVTSVPGKNGDLFFDNERFENLDVKYPAFIYANFDQNISALRNFLSSQKSYQRLEDTYHPDEFRLAVFKEAIDPEVWFDNSFGEFDVVFNCKPQRFLKSGEVKKTYTNRSFSITNPTLFDAKPLIRVYGSGDLTIGGTVITISDIASYVDLDFDTMNAYRDTVSKNRQVVVSSIDYPPLKPGTNNITFSTDISKIEITPRWYII